ncbi:MAG: hypothetical protein K5694_02620 [Bacilli bacterium]|nr:hypothetical protein [Bacilli bacterium]
MKNSSSRNVIAVFTIIFAVVAVFVMFAPAFHSNNYGTTLGSVFHVMFGNESAKYAPLPLLIVAFIFAVIGALVALSEFFLEGKNRKIVLASEAIIFLAVGTVFFFIRPIFSATNHVDLDLIDETGLGAGTICVIIFSYLAAAINLLGLALEGKNKNAPAPAPRKR